MKRPILLILVLSILLYLPGCCCLNMESFLPRAEVSPVEPIADASASAETPPATEYTTAPTEVPTEAPTEVPTEAPTQATVPELSTESYLQKIKRADQTIWSGPGYDYRCVGTVEVPGTYTIVEEALDSEGNLWGKLKSDAGWVDLTQIRSDTSEPPVLTAKLADAQLLASGNYHHCIADTSEYMVQVAFRITQTVTNVSLCQIVFNGYDDEAVEIFHISQWRSTNAFVADIAFPGDMSTYLIRFTDSAGAIYAYQLYTSGKDGSLVLSPVTP